MILSNFNGIELKPCKCGNTDIIVKEDVTAGIYECSIGCSKTCPNSVVTKIGYSKANALEKAAKEWNDR